MKLPSGLLFALGVLGCASDLGGSPPGDGELDAGALEPAADAGRAGDAQTGDDAADAGSPDEGPEESFRALYADILAPKCAGPYCHVATHRGGLNLTSLSVAYQRLVGRPGGSDERDPYSLCKDGGVLRVAPGDPDASLLMHKLTRGDDAVCGKPMPLDQPRLPEVDLARLRRWIAQGARDN